MADINRDIIIREALDSNAQDIVAIIREAMTIYASESGISGILPSLKETEEDISRYIREDKVLIAESGKMIAGTIRIREVSATEAEISRFAVLPAFHKSGMGSRLFIAAEEEIIKAGYESITLHTSLNNRKLLNFYISRGFVVESQSLSNGYRRGALRKRL